VGCAECGSGTQFYKPEHRQGQGQINTVTGPTEAQRQLTAGTAWLEAAALLS
jgi:hypothetical protein